MNRSSFLFREAFINLARNLLVVVGAVVAVFFSLALAFGALGVNEILANNTREWQEGTHVVAFFRNTEDGGPEATEHARIQAGVETWAQVKSVVYMDKAAAYVEAQELFAHNPAILEDFDASKLPASLRIELYEIADWSEVRTLLQADPSFSKVISPGEQFDQLAGFFKVVNAFGIGLALTLGSSAVILIATTIRMAIYARRDEVSIMKLVGASNWFIRVPFVLEGVIEGVLGAGMAVLVVWIASRSLIDLRERIQWLDLTIPNSFFVQWGMIFIVFGAVAGALGSMVGLSRYLREAGTKAV